MQYNYRKLQVLYVIKVCADSGGETNTTEISNAIGVKTQSISRVMPHYLKYKYVTRRCPTNRTGYMYYSLTKRGTHTLKLYMARYLNGMHLNLKFKPAPCDFKDDGILLPGYENDKQINDKH